MQICNMNPDMNTISLWVNNLDDMKMMFSNITPQVLKSLHKSFASTNFCSTTKIARLNDDQTNLSRNVFVKNSSVMNETIASTEMSKLSGNKDYDENATVVPCYLQMLDVRWIFGETMDKMNRSYGDLMVIFDDAPREVFECELVKSCIEKEWKLMKNRILIWKVLMMAIYLGMTNLYYAAYMFSRNPPNKGISEWANRFSCKSWSQAMRWAIIAFILYFLTIEILQMRRFGSAYWNASNIFDLAGVLMNLLVMMGHMFNFLFYWKARCAAIATFIMWIQIFRVLIVFDGLAFYLRLMAQLIRDISPFLILFAV